MRRAGLAAVAAVFAAGAALRIWFLDGYRPAFMGHPDSRSFVDSAAGEAFGVPEYPAGYPLLLRLARLASSDPNVAVALQHALGLGAAALTYLAVRRLSGSRWAALAAAAVLALDGFAVFLEHALLSEALFAFLVAAALYAAVRTLGADPLAWSALAGACVAASATVRAVGIALVPVFAVWLAARPGGRRRGLAAAASLCAAGALVTAGYQAVQHARGGGLTLRRIDGWNLYARVAPFADCSRFTPPRGTRALCESRPPGRRDESNSYLWDRGLPGRRLYGGMPRGNDELRGFAWRAILHQPLDYARTAGGDLARYGASDWEVGATVRQLQDPANERRAAPYLRRYYRPGGYHRAGADGLSRYPAAVHLAGWPLALVAALALAAPLLARGAARRGSLLLAATGFTLLLVPVLFIFGRARFGVPAYGALAAAAALGGDALLGRLRHGSHRGAGPAPATRDPA